MSSTSRLAPRSTHSTLLPRPLAKVCNDEIAKLQKLLAAGKISRGQFVDYAQQADRPAQPLPRTRSRAPRRRKLLGGDLGPAFMASIDAYLDRANKGVVEKMLPGMENAGGREQERSSGPACEAAREISARSAARPEHISAASSA
jgi:hypothetical protein